MSELRRFYLAARYEPDVICGNTNFLIPDPDGLAFAIISSALFMTWQKTIGGRLKSDLRFSKTFTYNTFPLPRLKADERARAIAAGAGIQTACGAQPGVPLADLYEPRSMPAGLVDAHAALDAVIDGIFRATDSAEVARQTILFRRYAQLADQTS